MQEGIRAALCLRDAIEIEAGILAAGSASGQQGKARENGAEKPMGLALKKAKKEAKKASRRIFADRPQAPAQADAATLAASSQPSAETTEAFAAQAAAARASQPQRARRL